jgi:hypothetical protein
MKRVLDIRLEGDAERARRSIVEAIDELQRLPVVPTQIINDVLLADSVVTLVPHRLGRTPAIALHSPPRGAATVGIISEIVDVAAGNPDRSKFVALKASGMGATVTVDVEVK